ncbi:cell death-inducing p53-target protein 1 homolog [Asterias rubens]|uniref:cell death-inducing p53-target protein 1 homolog n=1 Tax=Asterias rubens TaxID=7604 RepID=UPI001455A894|nr:cell death-inducing p53-target protein 1 homolog [Asterias rubens]XP_033630670.1 cell death-inducing p53-target protein 1 homolog [Asterias rubens]XP_033630671.1 cell death-inducing p53-target protein 1 homolog [Asterias rubens]
MESKEVPADVGQANTQEYPGGPVRQGAPMPVTGPAPYPAAYSGPPPPHEGYPMQPPQQGAYPMQPPQQGAYPMQPPPQEGYPMQPPQQGDYPMNPPPVYTAAAQPVPGSVPPPVPPGYANTLVIRPNFSVLPCTMNCPNCNNLVTTVTHKEIGLMVWLMVGGMILVGLWLGCCLIPFCIDGIKDTVHTCPNCKHTLGKFTHM